MFELGRLLLFEIQEDFGKINRANLKKSPVISPNFLVGKFCGKAQFPYSFGWIAQNYVTVAFHKISTPENFVKYGIFCNVN